MASGFRAKIAIVALARFPSDSPPDAKGGQVRRMVPRLSAIRATWSMTPVAPARQAWEVRDGADNRTTIVLSGIAREMRRPGPRAAPTPNPRQALHITLREGFRGHAVIIVVNGREVYRRDSVTTDPTSSRADAFELAVASRMPHIAIFATPGDYVAALDLDVSAHPHLAISLVGEGTVSVETSAHRFT